LATLFFLLSVILSIRYLKAGGKVLIGASLSFLAALLNKESAYAVLLVVTVLVLSRNHWGLPTENVGRTKRLLLTLLCVSLATIAIRISIYGNLGGYSIATGQNSPHFTIGIKTLTTLATHLMPLSVLVVNTSYLNVPAERAVLALFSSILAATAVLARVNSVTDHQKA
jgi:hypothetical protein